MAAAQFRDAAAAQAVQVLPVDRDMPARRPFDQRDQLEQGALARAGMPGHEGHLAGSELERQLVHRLVPGRVALGDLVEADHRRGTLAHFTIWLRLKIGSRIASTMNSTIAPTSRITAGPSTAVSTASQRSSSRA